MVSCGAMLRESEMGPQPAPSEPRSAEATPLAEPPPAPADPRERIEALDMLRGLAILSILLVNIASFSMPEAVSLQPNALGTLGPADYVIWLGTHVLAEMKFINIFSMLFGAGVLLVTERVAARHGAVASTHYRRMLILGGFGLGHAYGLWFGDVLFTYSVCGCGVYLARRWRPRTQVLAGFLLMLPPSLFLSGVGLLLPYLDEGTAAEMRADIVQSPEVIAGEIAAYRGGWLEQMPYRAASATYVVIMMLPAWSIWRVGGLMLIGMALMKWNVLTGARSRRFYIALALCGLVAGFPPIVIGAVRTVNRGFDPVFTVFGGMEWNYWGSIGASLGYIALTMLIWQASRGARAVRTLAAVGRMALTNYLLQTLICTTIFYGHGLALFARVDRVGQLGIVLGVWAVCLSVSSWWLRRYRYGPMEWLWRALTYGRRPPMRVVCSAPPHSLTSPATEDRSPCA